MVSCYNDHDFIRGFYESLSLVRAKVRTSAMMELKDGTKASDGNIVLLNNEQVNLTKISFRENDLNLCQRY